MEGHGTTGVHERRNGTPPRVPAGKAPHRPLPGVMTITLAAGLALFAPPAAPGPAAAPTTIVDEWAAVKVPPPPALKPVTVDPAATALLILDILKQNCNTQRPRCVASVPRISALLAAATERKMLVVYSMFAGSQVDDVLAAVRPFPGQPVVAAGLDKFLGTNLEAILKGQNIKAVIVTGTAANGAVLGTGMGAALRGFQVYVPLDLMSAAVTYAEQYTAWHLANTPVISERITLTRSDLIRF